MGAFIDRVGQKFGRLTVLSRGKNLGGRVIWVCACTCGNTSQVSSANLVKKNTKSCGCLHKEVASAYNTVHGESIAGAVTGTYRTWLAMKRRCLNPDSPDYADYGGRGITIAPAWMDYITFLAAMGERLEGTTLDRIDNSKGYSKENCRWATAKMQAGNRRSNAHYQFDGAEVIQEELAAALGFGGRSQNISNWRRAGFSDDQIIKIAGVGGLRAYRRLQQSEVAC